MTIIGKIIYIIEHNQIKPSEILCISFTNASVESLKNKIKENYNYDIDVFTFHKLSLEILKQNNINYKICKSDTLEYIIDEYFKSYILDNSEAIMSVFKYYGVFVTKYNIKNKYIKYIHNNDLLKLRVLISKFIHLMKTNGYQIKDFLKFKNCILKRKEYYFLKLTIIIYQIYSDELVANNEIDFDDMIITATDLVYNSKKYKYIIIDEYQDSSMIRFNLIKEMISKFNASLFVVGDDFQSIYKFAGCNLNVMLKFKDYFMTSEILKISNTYRNSQELIDIAGKFIMKNNMQIKKNLKSDKHIKDPIIIVRYKKYRKDFYKLLDMIEGNILVLGRNNKDISYLCNIDKDGYIHYKERNIRYMTIHKSKGLEEDNIIIINLKNDILGIPSKVEDDKILNLVSPKVDDYAFSEERRLFYVAITRTKNRTYLYTPMNNESIFIKELKHISNIKEIKI